MNEYHLKIYIDEIIFQIEFVRQAARLYNQVIARPDSSTVQVAFAATQAFLSAVAMISKMLWPAPVPSAHIDGTKLTRQEKLQARDRANQRGNTLRQELGEIEVNALVGLKKRVVRNGLEHFDERLDQYLFEAGKDANIIDRNIMPLSGKSLSLRNINPDNHVFSILGDKANMQELMSAVDALYLLCTSRLARTK